MNIPPPSAPRRLRGFALMTTLALMAVCLIIFASIFSWTFTNAKITQRNIQYNMSENAAEAAVERVIGQIDRDFINAVISNSTAYVSLPVAIDQSTWPVQYSFSGTNGNSGSVQPRHGIPARVFDDCRFHRMRLHGECVIGPRQPRS